VVTVVVIVSCGDRVVVASRCDSRGDSVVTVVVKVVATVGDSHDESRGDSSRGVRVKLWRQS
jgi:hypothetical protein